MQKISNENANRSLNVTGESETVSQQLQNFDVSVETILSESIDIKMREHVIYTSDELADIKDDKNSLLSKISKITRRQVIYENQNLCSLKIVSSLYNRKIINIMVLALTQSGKTGTMLSLINNYLQYSEIMPIPVENIYIITGLSSVEWVKQTKDRMPLDLQERIYHRNELGRAFLDDIKKKKNILIIIDEIQVAAQKNQTLYNVFQEAGFYDKQTLLKKDIKIIEFTATPDGTVYDHMKWGENSEKIKMEPGDGYTSCFDLLDQNRIYQHKDLCGFDKTNNEVLKVLKEDIVDNFNELKEVINAYNEPLYHIIRTPNGSKADMVIDNFKDFFGKDIKNYKYDKDSDIIININKILEKKPEKHTFIFIKEKLRCAITLCKTYLGVVYERCPKTEPDDASIIQGLVGRVTGYDVESRIKVFTNIDSIQRYKKHWDTKFEDKSIPWKSKTTKMFNNETNSKGTFNQKPKCNDDMSTSSSEESIVDKEEPLINKFTNFQDAKEYVLEWFKKENSDKKRRGPNNPKKFINEEGFYECKVRTVKKVWSTKEMFQERRCNIKNGAGYGIRYCYNDINDKNSLEFWIIHY